MIRIRLINEGKVVKQITSRVHEGVVLEQINKYKDPFDTIQIVEGELSEGAKDMLQHVARKIVPAAMAAGLAMGGANASAQGGVNPNYPGMNKSVGQHISDIVSPNYKEIMRQREHGRNTERQVWDAEQNEIRKQRVADARARAGGGQQHVIYDQSRLSQDGKSYIIYGIDNKVRRIPVAGTEYMTGDSQRLPHYITSGGSVLYVRHPHALTGVTESIGGSKDEYAARDAWVASMKKKYPNGKIATARSAPTGFVTVDGKTVARFPAKKVAEGVAETMTMDEAKKVLRHHGADNFKTTSNELHFYKNGKPFTLGLTLGKDGIRTVSLSSLNSATRKLKGVKVAEAFIAPALSAANANAEYERTRTHLGGYKGRVDTEVSGKDEYFAVMKALTSAAKQAGQHVECGLSDNKMSIFSDSMNSNELDEFVDDVLEQGLDEGYTVTRGIDKERYQERPGLEGPFSTRSGKVVYYDPKEGKYYDPETDFYIGHEDYAKMDEAAPGLVKAAAGLALGGVAAAGAPAIVAILGPLLGIPMAAYGAYSAAKLGIRGVEQLWDLASEKLGGDDKVAQYASSKIATLPPEQQKAAAATVKQIGESKQGVVEGADTKSEHDKGYSDAANGIKKNPYNPGSPSAKAYNEGQAAYSRHFSEDATVGTIPASGTVGTSGRTQFAPTGKTTNATFNKNGQIELDTEQEDDGSVNLDSDAVKQLQQAGVKIKEEEGHSPAAYAITRRILMQRPDLLQKYGPVLVTQAIDEVADFVGDVEEIGSSDVSGWVKHVEQMLADNPPEAFNEGSDTLEGILSKFSTDYAKFKAGGDIDENEDFFQALFDYYSESGEMPYGVQKARTGDPYEWITQQLDQESGVSPVIEADGDEATPGEQAAADQNIIMQIRKASDYEKPTRIELADGSKSVIAPNIAKQILAKFDKMKPESKALLQDTLNTEEGFKEILAYFGGGVREQAATRAASIMQSAMADAGLTEGPLDDVRARMDARRNPPAKPAANLPTTPLPPVPPYTPPAGPEATAELKAGDIIGYRPKNAKMIPIKAKVLKLLSGDRAMVSVSSPRMIAQNNGSPVITIGPLSDLDIQNPYKAVAKESVVNEAAVDWLPAYNALVKGDGEPAKGGHSGNLNWKKSMALSAKDNGIDANSIANFIKQYAQNGKYFGVNSQFDNEWNQLVQEIWKLVQQAPTMDEMRDAVKQQAAGVHQQNLTNIQNQLDLENAPLQHELSVQALLNKAELDQADQKELLELDMEARLAIIKIKQDLELDAKERLVAIEREIEDRKEREDVRKHELEMAQAGYKHEIAVINATAEGEYKKAKLEADYQIQIKQLDNIDNAGERQNRLDQINTEKAKQLAVIDAETKSRVEVMQKEVDVERQQSDIKIEQAFMMTFNPIWGAALTAAHAAGATWKAGINNLNKALGMLSKPIMPTAQKESRYDRRDAYQRDYDSSVAGMGKRQSLAYQLDGGANDEGWDKPEQERSYYKKAPVKKGYYFYNVPADQTAKAEELGLFKTKSGKWYSPFENTRANMFFGTGRYWEPK